PLERHVQEPRLVRHVGRLGLVDRRHAVQVNLGAEALDGLDQVGLAIPQVGAEPEVDDVLAGHGAPPGQFGSSPRVPREPEPDSSTPTSAAVTRPAEVPGLSRWPCRRRSRSSRRAAACPRAVWTPPTRTTARARAATAAAAPGPALRAIRVSGTRPSS